MTALSLTPAIVSEVGEVLTWQCWKLNFFIMGHLTELQVQHQLLQTGSSPRAQTDSERLLLSEREKIPPSLTHGLLPKQGHSRALLLYQILQGLSLTGD